MIKKLNILNKCYFSLLSYPELDLNVKAKIEETSSKIRELLTFRYKCAKIRNLEERNFTSFENPSSSKFYQMFKDPYSPNSIQELELNINGNRTITNDPKIIN